MVLWSAALWCLLASAFGANKDDDAPPVDPAVIKAEHQRLSGDMEQLAKRQHWTGVEQKFVECQALRVPLSYDDLIHGAHAARGLGDAQAAYDRLRAAVKIMPSREAVDWLWDIDSAYGHVTLATVPRRSASLVMTDYPFAPDQRAAVDHAAAVLRESGEFNGLLPQGVYSLEGTEFEVSSGLSFSIEISTRGKRQVERTQPVPESPGP